MQGISEQLSELIREQPQARNAKGKISTSRVIFLVWGLGVFAVWAFLSFYHQQTEPLDTSVVTVLGILAGGKTLQRFGERENSQ